MKKVVSIIIFCILQNFIIFGQDSLLIGKWKGSFIADFAYNKEYSFNLAIEMKENEFIGYSYSSNRDYNGVAQIKIFKKEQTFIIKEDSILKNVNYNNGNVTAACLMTCKLILSEKKNKYILQGFYTAEVEKTNLKCSGGWVYLEKKKK